MVLQTARCPHPNGRHNEDPIARVLACAGSTAKEPYRYTPLDFVELQAHILTLWPRLCRHFGPFNKPLRRSQSQRRFRYLRYRFCIDTLGIDKESQESILIDKESILFPTCDLARPQIYSFTDF
jgi:hypothetical protein